MFLLSVVLSRQSPILNGTDDVLFSVWTDSNFYDTRLTGILNTWGKEIPAERFVAVSAPGQKLHGSVA